MEIAELFERVISNSEYEGNFAFDSLLDHMQETGQSGFALEEDGRKNFFLIFVGGEPEGAALIEERGMLFGDKAVLLLKREGVMRLFVVEGEFAEALAARCKVYDKSHLKRSFSEELPQMGGNTQTMGRLCVVIKKNDEMQSGVRIELRKGRQVIGGDITAGDGKICFKVMNGLYDCLVTDRDQKSYKYRISFQDSYTLSEIDIGGAKSNE